MHLNRLCVTNFRNITQAEISPHPYLNWIVGNNGSGKTSLLESIFTLCRGRSFRSSRGAVLVNQNKMSMQCFGKFVEPNKQVLTLGYSKEISGSSLFKFNDAPCKKLSEYALHVPVNIIDPDSGQLISGNSEGRRQFIDLGMFHVKPEALDCLNRYNRALKQRNQVLKFKKGVGLDLLTWEQELVKAGEVLNSHRQAFFEKFISTTHRFIEDLSPELKISFVWQKGWEQNQTLAEALELSYSKDSTLGYTSVGPHRSDFLVDCQLGKAKEFLSRGQIKTMALILHISLASCLYEVSQKKSIFLIDDLDAEFDSISMHKMLNLLLLQGHQLYITCLDQMLPSQYLPIANGKTFHVEHGHIYENACG